MSCLSGLLGRQASWNLQLLPFCLLIVADEVAPSENEVVFGKCAWGYGWRAMSGNSCRMVVRNSSATASNCARLDEVLRQAMPIVR